MLNRVYIGSNNKTGRLEYSKAIGITAKQFEGFTAMKGLSGYWQNQKEESMILEIETEDKGKIKQLIQTLLKGLNQESIGWAVIGKMDFVSA